MNTEERDVYMTATTPARRTIVNVPLPLDELQLLYRLRQLRNAGQERALVRLSEWQVDERRLDNP